jgi:AcrR family transcriptional regulator
VPVSPRRSWRGTTAADRAADRRRRLIDAGFELFGTDGYARTSIDALCSAAGLSLRSFYELVHDREELMRLVWDEVVQETLDEVREAVSAFPMRTEVRLHAGLAAYVGHMTTDPRRARIVHLSGVGLSPGLERHRRRAIHAFADVITEEVEPLRGPRDSGDDRMLALAVVGAVNELLVEWLLQENPPDPDTIVSEAAALLLGSLALRGRQIELRDRPRAGAGRGGRGRTVDLSSAS